jgi:hypothetical protein
MPLTGIGTTLSCINTNRGSFASWNDRDNNSGASPLFASTQMRDNTMVLLDESQNLHFSIDRNTKVTVATGFSGYHFKVMRNTTDQVVVAYIDNSHYIKINTYAKPAMGWASWVAGRGTPALSVTTWTPHRLIQSTDIVNFRNVGQFHIMQSANISNGILFLGFHIGGYSGNDYNSSTCLGYTYNLNTGAILDSGGVYTGDQYGPKLSGGNWGAWTMYANYYGNFTNISLQNKPYGNYFVDNSMRTDGNLLNSQANEFSGNATNGQFVYYYYGKSVDANGIITYQGNFQNGYNTTYGGPRWQSDFNGTTNTGAHTTKACQAPVALANNTYNYFFISEIKNSKPMIYMPALGQNVFASTYSTLPTGFVFDTMNACPIQWIEETQTLRVWGSNGTAVTYVDCAWTAGSNTLTWGSTATVVASSGGSNATIHTTNAPIYTINDIHYGTTANTTTTGITSAYAYSSSYSIPEPYVPVLKANNGMKFQTQAQAVTTTASTTVYDGTQNYNPWQGPGTTFQFRRVSSGGTEYYNYTTSAWTSSVVNNAQSLFPSGGGYIPSAASTGYFLNDIQGTWADNTSYTYSWVFTDPNSITYQTGTRVIATPAVQAAPTSPTPRRMFVFTLQNRTSSHVLSVKIVY